MKVFRCLVTSVLVLSTSAALAAPVSEEDAASVARGYLASVRGALLGGSVASRGVATVRTLTETIDGAPVALAHVVSFDRGGWVIVAADDRLDPIVGFSADGEWGDAPADSADSGTGFLVQKLSEEFSAVEQLAPEAAAIPRRRGAMGAQSDGADNAAPDISDAIAANRARHARYAARGTTKDSDDPLPPMAPPDNAADLRVGQLLQTTWQQRNSGENTYTPSNYVCGCTATAIAQVMYYHQWPQEGIGVITNRNGSFYDSSGSRIYITPPTSRWPVAAGTRTCSVNDTPGVFATRGGNGAGGPYQWSEMTTGTSGSTTAKQARGALCYDVGVLVGMNWGYDGSGSHSDPRALLVMGYANGATLKVSDSRNKDNLTTGGMAGLTNSICANLDAGFPCVLSIYNADGSGHAVVADGYGFEDGELFFHINLGWGGTRNGFYKWDNIDSRDHYWTSFIMFNIFPQTAGEIVSGRAVDAGGEPIEGAVVTVADSGGYRTNCVTNAKGIWSAVGVGRSKNVTVTATHPDYQFRTAATVATATSDNYQSVPSNSHCGNVWGVELVGLNPDTPPELGAVSARADSATEASVSAELAVRGANATTVTLTADVSATGNFDAPDQTASVILEEPGTATFAFGGLTPSTTYSVRVIATATTGLAATNAPVSFTTPASARVVGWFDVRFAAQGYVTGVDWSDALPADAGGTWRRPAGDASRIGVTNGVTALVLDTEMLEPVVYTATHASDAGTDVVVTGSVCVAMGAAATLPSDMLLGIAFTSEGPEAQFSGVRIPLEGAVTYVDGDWVDYEIRLDLSSDLAPRAAFAANGVPLTYKGARYLPIGTATDRITGIAFGGGGAVGDFSAHHLTTNGTGEVTIDRPIFGGANGEAALSFGTNTAGDPIFSVGITNAVEGLYYTAWVSETLTGPYEPVRTVQATADGVLRFEMDAGADSCFVKIVVSDEEP